MPTHSTLRIKLLRWGHSPKATTGTMFAGGFVVLTREVAWCNNEPHMSCIPLGNYRVIRDTDCKSYDRWIICGVPHRLAAEIEVSQLDWVTAGHIVMEPYCSYTRDDWKQDPEKPTGPAWEELTKDINRLTLEIVQVQPYTEYLREYGFAKPPTEEIEENATS